MSNTHVVAADCSICLEPLTSSSPSSVRCGHRFHAPCIASWFRQPESGGRCPLCRTVISDEHALPPQIQLFVSMDRLIYEALGVVNRRVMEAQEFIFECRVCGRTYASQRSLQQHYDAVHVSEFRCFCGRSLRSERAHTQHMEAVHPFYCRDCTVDHPNRAEFQDHNERLHTRCRCRICDEEEFEGTDARNDHEVYAHRTCHICERVFPNAQALTNHSRAVHSDCEACGERCGSLAALRLHVDERHTEHRCRTCNAAFPGSILRDQHEMNHRRCVQCDRIFVNAHALANHTRAVHARCPHCELVFSASNLQAHIVQRHTTVTCAECNQSFNGEALLNEHSVVHRTCQDCNRVFVHAQALRNHLRDIHPVPCRYCAEPFAYLEMRNAHEIWSHETCHECNRVFASGRARVQHWNAKHGYTPAAQYDDYY